MALVNIEELVYVRAIDIRVENRVLAQPSSGYGAGTVGNGIAFSSQPAYRAYANPQYNYTTHTLDFTAWLDAEGQVVTTPTSCNIVVTETNGGVIVANVNSSLPNGNGVFYLSQGSVTLNPNKNYSIIVTIVSNGVTYISADAAQGLN